MILPADAESVDVEGITRGIHRIAPSEGDGPWVQLMASGVGVPWALHAREILAEDWGVRAGVWSVTSWGELRREALEIERKRPLEPAGEHPAPYGTAQLRDAGGPFVASSD